MEKVQSILDQLERVENTRHYSNRPTVTITVNGATRTLRVNAAAYMAMGEPRFVELYLDREHGMFAIKPVSARTGGCFITNNSGNIAGGIFIKHALGIRAKKYQVRLDAEWDGSLLWAETPLIELEKIDGGEE